MKKEYCVHIYERYHEVDDVMADTPEDAELIAMKRFNNINYDDIDHVEVMLVHHCDEDEAYDNEADAKVCGNCGAKLTD